MSGKKYYKIKVYYYFVNTRNLKSIRKMEIVAAILRWCYL